MTDDRSAQKDEASRDAAGVDTSEAERLADEWLARALRRMATDSSLLTAVHVKIESILIEYRDAGIFTGNSRDLHANGLVVRYRDRTPSDVIRIGTRQAVSLALEGAAEYLEASRQADPEGP